MAKTVAEVQEEIFAEIEDPEKRIRIRVQKKELRREDYLNEIRKRCRSEKLTEAEAEEIVFVVDKSLWGFGIIDALVNIDDTVSDIRLTDKKNIRVKRNGKREATDIEFISDDEYKRYIEFITNRNQTTMSVNNAAQVFTDKESSPTNILRFTLASDLINTNGMPSLLIRKIPKNKKTFETLLSESFLTSAQRDYLVRRWQTGHGMLVCGPNGSGKTTFTNALLDKTPHEKSAVVIQESEELFSKEHPEMIFRKVVPRRAEGSVSYELEDLARLGLMESFDVMVIGEIKGKEAADLAYATYTGSQCMTTVHSISAEDAYEKLIDYALEAHPERDRGHFAKQLQKLDTVVFVDDYKIRSIRELVQYNAKTEEYTFREPDIMGMLEGRVNNSYE